jgi:hypothetical protein
LVAVTGAVYTVTPAIAETQIGSAGKVVRDVTGKLESAVRTIDVRDQVFQNDLIETKKQSATELIFLDGTKLSIGPNRRPVRVGQSVEQEKGELRNQNADSYHRRARHHLTHHRR